MERMKVKYVIDGKDYVTLPAYEILEKKYNQLEEENKKLKEDNKRLREGVDAGQKLVEDLISKNKKLESDLEECECSMHFENDEVGYRKRECKKLKE